MIKIPNTSLQLLKRVKRQFRGVSGLYVVENIMNFMFRKSPNYLSETVP